VILSQKAATEGPNKTLDFIPGNCFLGIVAAMYSSFDNDTYTVFHSGKVRFGDAHLSEGRNRGLKIPACMFFPKLGSPEKELYIYHGIKDLESEQIRQKQLKQCRSGFYVFRCDSATRIEPDLNFAIKSAYDKKSRKSMNGQMYGYESLCKGSILYFDVEVDDENLADKIKNVIVGRKNIGRSRSAQYGLVLIEEYSFENVKNSNVKNGIVTVYADGRLIFLDEYGMPYYRPTAQQLGLPNDAVIRWDLSQIRTFKYSPWNFTRQSFDTDRCGIEKGSVFVVDVSKCSDVNDLMPHYVGSYTNEGFGKVIYNPYFLEFDEKGLAKCLIRKHSDLDKKTEITLGGTPLLDYLSDLKNMNGANEDVYDMVNEWVAKNRNKFTDSLFASQWGHIRSIAMKYRRKKDIEIALYEGKNSYLEHGICSAKWKEKRRLIVLKDFCSKLNDSNISAALINLSAEMAKSIRRLNHE
jgi:hypothetical protein